MERDVHMTRSRLTRMALLVAIFVVTLFAPAPSVGQDVIDLGSCGADQLRKDRRGHYFVSFTGLRPSLVT